MIDLTPVFQALTGLLAVAITAVVIPLVKSRLNAEQLERAKHWARIVAKAAEMIFPQPGSGQQKKAYALEVLSRRRLKLEAEELDILVECAVCELKNEASVQKEAQPCRS